MIKHPQVVQASLAELMKKRGAGRPDASVDKAALVRSNASVLFGLLIVTEGIVVR